MSDELRRQEVIDRCIERLLDGESLDDVLASYPGEGARLLPLLEAAGALVRAPSPRPSPAARSLAMSRMLAQVSAEARREPQPQGGVLAWLGTLRARPLAFQALAVAGAVVLFGGLGIGASAATGTTPSPVRTFFGLPDNSPKNVRLSGAVLSASADTLVIDTADGEKTIAFGSSTALKRGNSGIPWSDLLAGETVDVTGTERDGHIVAGVVSAQPPLEPTEPAGAALQSTPGADDGNHAETPQADRTPEDRRGRESRTPEQPDAAATSGHEGDRGTPPATGTPNDEGGRTPGPTQSPDQEHSDAATPWATQTPWPGSGDGGGDR